MFEFDLQLFATSAADRALKARQITAKKMLENKLVRSRVFIPEYKITKLWNKKEANKGSDVRLSGELLAQGWSPFVQYFCRRSDSTVKYLDGSKMCSIDKSALGNGIMAMDNIVSIDLSALPGHEASRLSEMMSDGQFGIQERKSGDALMFFEDDCTAVVVSTKDGESRTFCLIPGADGEETADIALYNRYKNYGGSKMSWYWGAFAGPSQQKNCKFYAFKLVETEAAANFEAPAAKKAAIKGGVERVLGDLDALSRGAVTAIKAKLDASGKKGVDYAKLFKLVGRIALTLTPATKVFTGTTFAYLHGEFGTTVAKNRGIAGEHAPADGMAFVSANVLAKAMSTADITFTEEDMLKVKPQFRSFGGMIGKGMAIPFPYKGMEESMAMTDKEGTPIRVSHEEFYALDKAGKLEEGRVYISGEGEPEIWLDSNSLKLITPLGNDEGFDFMVAMEPNASRAKLNKQDVIHALHIDGFRDYAIKVGKAHVNRRIKAALKQHDGIVDPNGYVNDVIRDMAPGYAAGNRFYRESLLKNLVKGLVKDISRLNFEVRGKYARIIQDPCHALTGIKLLGKGEVFDPDKGHLLGRVEAEVTRNPRTYAKEHYSCHTVGLHEIEIRLARLVGLGRLSVGMEAALMSLYRAMDDGIVVVPADPDFANKTGGSDFDGDGAFIHYDREYVNMLRKDAQGVSIIPKFKGDGSKRLYAGDLTPSQFMRFSVDGTFGQEDAYGNRSFPDGIGVLDNQKTVITGLWFEDDAVLAKIIDRFCKPMAKKLGYVAGDKKYVVRYYYAPVTAIGNKEVKECAEAFYQSDMSIASLRGYILDCMAACPSVIGRGIDVNKTAEIVFSGLLGCIFGHDIEGHYVYKAVVGKVVSRDNWSYEVHVDLVGDEKDEHAPFVASAVLSGNSGKNDIVINGVTTSIRQEVMDYALDKINALFKDAAEMPWVSACEQKLMDNGIGMIRKGAPTGAFLRDLVMIKRAYGYAANRDNDLHKVYADVFANTVRHLFMDRAGNSATDVEKYIGCLRASFDINVKSYEKPTAFRGVLQEEQIIALAGMEKAIGHAVNDRFGYKAVTSGTSGVLVAEKVNFRNGYGVVSSGDVIVTDKNVSGVWTVEGCANELTVTRGIKEAFSAPAVDNRWILVNSYTTKSSSSTPKFATKAFAGKDLAVDINNNSGKWKGRAIYGNAAKKEFVYISLPSYVNEDTDEYRTLAPCESKYTYFTKDLGRFSFEGSYTSEYLTGEKIFNEKKGKEEEVVKYNTVLIGRLHK